MPVPGRVAAAHGWAFVAAVGKGDAAAAGTGAIARPTPSATGMTVPASSRPFIDGVAISFIGFLRFCQARRRSPFSGFPLMVSDGARCERWRQDSGCCGAIRFTSS
jgi:hypothetical protein